MLEILIHLVQPLEEKVCPRPPSGTTQHQQQPRRPASAMTSQEREQAMQQAMGRMSAKVRKQIEEALGHNDSTSNSSKPSEQLMKTRKEDPCKHTDRPLSCKSLTPLKEVEDDADDDYLTKEEINAEYDAIVEDLEEEDHPIDLIDVGKELGKDVNGTLGNCNKSKMQRTASAKSRPGSAAMYEHQDYQNYARSRVSSGVTRPTSAASRPKSAKQSHDNIGNKLVSGKETIEEADLPTKHKNGILTNDFVACNSNETSTPLDCNIAGKGEEQKWETTLRSANRRNSTCSVTSQTSVSSNTKMRRPQNSKFKSNHVKDKIRIVKKNTGDMEKLIMDRQRMNGKTFDNGCRAWKGDVELWRPVGEQCRERIVKTVGSMIITQLFSKSHTSKMDALDFLDQYVTHGQVRLIKLLTIAELVITGVTNVV